MVTTSHQPDPEREELLRLLGTDASGLYRPEQAQSIVDVMRAVGQSQAPSEESAQRVWRRIEATMAASQPARAPWWNLLLAWPMMAVALSVVALGIGVALFSQGVLGPEFEVSALRSVPSRVAIPDFKSSTPGLVGELRAMGIAATLERKNGEIAVTAEIPQQPPTAWEAWKARWGVVSGVGKKLTLTLVPRTPASDVPAATPSAPGAPAK